MFQPKFPTKFFLGVFLLQSRTRPGWTLTAALDQESLIMDRSHIMKQNADIQEGISQA